MVGRSICLTEDLDYAMEWAKINDGAINVFDVPDTVLRDWVDTMMARPGVDTIAGTSVTGSQIQVSGLVAPLLNNFLVK